MGSRGANSSTVESIEHLPLRFESQKDGLQPRKSHLILSYLWAVLSAHPGSRSLQCAKLSGLSSHPPSRQSRARTVAASPLLALPISDVSKRLR